MIPAPVPAATVRRALLQTWTPTEKNDFKKSVKVELKDELTALAKAYYYKSYWFRYQETVDNYVDGELDRLIGAYGPQNADVIRMRIRHRAGKLNANAGAMLDVLDEVSAGLPATMRTESNLANLKTALFRFAGGFDEKTLKEAKPDTLKQQWAPIRKNLVLTAKRVEDDWKVLQRKFGIKGSLARIQMTGSDFHNGGQSVSIAESDRGEKVVYKPRSLSPDITLMAEEGSIFAELNKQSENYVGLPTAKFHAEKDKKGEYGYMEFLAKAPVLGEKAAQLYYYRMGQVAVAAKLLGMTDLHQENVIAGGGTPFLIDAEASFLPYVMLSETFQKTGFQDALLKVEGLKSPNVFLTVGEVKELESLRKDKPNLSETEFIKTKRRQVLAGESPLSDFLQRGVLSMLLFVKKNQSKLVEYLTQRATKVEHVRMVPLHTRDFGGLLQAYNNPKVKREKVLQAAADDIEKEVEAVGFELEKTATKTLISGLKQDFDRRDVPVLRYEPKLEALFHGNVVIAKTKKGYTLVEAIKTTVLRLCKVTVEDVLKSYGER